MLVELILQSCIISVSMSTKLCSEAQFLLILPHWAFPLHLFHLWVSLLMKSKATGHDMLPIMKFRPTVPHIFCSVILCSVALHSSIEEIPWSNTSTNLFWILQQINQMIADVDKDGSGAIDYEEFEHMMTAKIGERDSKEELTKAFRIIDQDRNVNHHCSFLPATQFLYDCTGPAFCLIK